MSTRKKSEGAGKSERVLLFLGDPVVTDPEVRRAIDVLIPRERQQVDLEIVRAGEDCLDRTIEHLSQVGMFSTGRCVWVRGMTAEPAEAASRFLDFLAGKSGPGLSPDSAIVASASHLDKRSRLYKWFSSHATVTDLALEVDRQGRLKEEQAVDFVAARIKASGLTVPTRRTLALIAGRAGSDVGQLAQEVDKLCVACDADATVTDKLVRTHMRDQAQAWVYDLTGAISARDAGSAQRVIEKLVGQGEPPLRLLATLATHLANLIEASRLVAGLPPTALRNAGAFARDYFPKLPEAAREHFKTGFRAFYAFQGAAAFKPAELVGLHRELLSIDLRLKSSRADPIHLFGAFLQRACAAGA